MFRRDRPVRRSAALHAIAARRRSRFHWKIEPAIAVLLVLLLVAGLAFQASFHSATGELGAIRDLARRVAGARMDGVDVRALADRSAAFAATAERARRVAAAGTALDVLLIAAVAVAFRRDVAGRRRAEAALRELATVDPLTGLLNRRGFLEFGAEHIGLASRFGRPVGLFFADLDGLKAINDRFGHPEGDRALAAAAGVLRGTFRASDVVARWSGDEFVVLTVLDSAADEPHIVARLERNLDEFNASGGLPFPVSLSVGAMTSNGETGIPDLVARADAAMYREKNRRRTSGR